MQLKRLSKDAKLPFRKYANDAGLDFYSVESYTLLPGSQYTFKTGWELVSVEQPSWDDRVQCCLFAWSKSGLDGKQGLHVGAGVIDHNYRGEIMFLVKNMGTQTVKINIGDPLGQLVPMLYYPQTVEVVEESAASDRGADGGITKYKTATITVPVTVEIDPKNL